MTHLYPDAPPVIAGQGIVQFWRPSCSFTIGLTLRLSEYCHLLGLPFQNVVCRGAITNLTLLGSTLPGTNTVTGTFNCTSGTLLTKSAGVAAAFWLTC